MQHETSVLFKVNVWPFLQQVPPERVVSVHDVSNIYHVPLLLLEQSEFMKIGTRQVFMTGAVLPSDAHVRGDDLK